jgi:cellulose synthase/poly-beta-1,6-N-acetylglucosamine synthase-like glycosyltransferase
MPYREIIYGITIFIYASLLPYFLFVLLVSLAALTTQKTHGIKRDTATPVAPRRRFLVVIPAHNEEVGIVRTVRSCLALSYPPSLFETVVIADNCTDRTASAAEKSGARVIERFDPSHAGKGHAIEYAIDTLACAGELGIFDALVLVDADSVVDPQLLERFSEGLERGEDWIQCFDAVSNSSRSWRTRLMAYGFSLINGVMLRGQSTLGLSAGLRGNGMCLSTRGLRRVPWTAHGLTEDLEYSWLVRIAGGRIAYADGAAVHATMLSHGGKAAVVQRLRWEHGRRALKWKMLGPLLSSPRLPWPEKLAAAIELTMPTNSFLFCSYLILTLLTLVTLPELHIQRNRPFFEYSIGFCYTITTLSWLLYAASPFLLALIPLDYVSSLLYIPYYAVWKAAIRSHATPTTWSPTYRELPSNGDAWAGGDDVRKSRCW